MGVSDDLTLRCSLCVTNSPNTVNTVEVSTSGSASLSPEPHCTTTHMCTVRRACCRSQGPVAEQGAAVPHTRCATRQVEKRAREKARVRITRPAPPSQKVALSKAITDAGYTPLRGVRCRVLSGCLGLAARASRNTGPHDIGNTRERGGKAGTDASVLPITYTQKQQSHHDTGSACACTQTVAAKTAAQLQSAA